MKDGRMRGGTSSAWLARVVSAERRVPEILADPEFEDLFRALEDTRWTGRPGFSLRAMTGIAAFKVAYEIPNWRDAVALLAMKPTLQRVLGCRECPSEWACYRFARKLRVIADEVDLSPNCRHKLGLKPSPQQVQAWRQRRDQISALNQAEFRRAWREGRLEHGLIARPTAPAMTEELIALLAAQERDQRLDVQGHTMARHTLSLDAMTTGDLTLGDLLTDRVDFTSESEIEGLLKQNGDWQERRRRRGLLVRLAA